MARKKVCYELYVYGRLAARGNIDLIAEALGVSAGYAQRIPYAGHKPRGIEVVPLPVLYDYRGRALRGHQVAKLAGVKEASVVSAACNKGGVGGYPVRKHEYDEFTVGAEKVEEWRREGKERGRRQD